MSSAAKQLESALERSLAAQGHRARTGRDPCVAALEAWQKRRLTRSYSDFAGCRRYRQATAFFTEELYAPGNLESRDQDLQRMVPFMTHLLPESAIRTVAEAVELQALTLELDLAMVDELPDDPPRLESMPLDDYADAYRRVGRAEDRGHQIALIMSVGQDLDRLVANPFIVATLKLCKGPARLAGLTDLHDFLEHGFGAFKAMGGAREFLAAIDARERLISQRLLAGETVGIDAADLPGGP